jgi:hypothetical protein
MKPSFGPEGYAITFFGGIAGIAIGYYLGMRQYERDAEQMQRFGLEADFLPGGVLLLSILCGSCCAALSAVVWSCIARWRSTR